MARMAGATWTLPNYQLVNNDKIVRKPGAPPLTFEEEEELMNYIGKYVEETLALKYGFVSIPIPDDDSPEQTSIMASSNWQTAQKMLLIIQNASGSMIGMFSRSICLKDGFSKGSMFPYVERAMSEGYAVLILRPNTNSIVETDPVTRKVKSKKPIIGSESPEFHALYVLENIIPMATASHIAFLGYGNGASLCKEMLLKQMVNSMDNGRNEANKIKAFCTIEASVIIEEDDAQDFRSVINSIAVNMETSITPRGYRLAYRKKKLGCTSLSLGLPPGRDEVMNVAEALSIAVDPVFQYFKIAETDATPSAKFAKSMAASHGHDPEKAVVTVNPEDPSAGEDTVGDLPDSGGKARSRFSMRNMVTSVFRKSESGRKSLSPQPSQSKTAGTTTKSGRFSPANGASAAPSSPPPPSLATNQPTYAETPPGALSKRPQSATIKAGSVPAAPAPAPANDEPVQLDQNELTINDFDLLKVVGKGAFGKVMLVKKNNGFCAGNIYAMKVLKKSVIAAKGQIEHTKSERAILCEIRHPFIVRLRFAFQSDEKLYLVTDYYNGGSLFYHLRKSKQFDEVRARFYAAQLMTALDHLHQQNIIYRDLKLENILMDHRGNIALTDFGLSKQDIDKTGGATTFCGTAEYIAPELLQGLRYGSSVDWWSFGILLFEMIQGRTPFYDKNRKLMFFKIMNTRPSFPPTFSEEVKECISGLLQVAESDRLGAGERGARDIMETGYFRPINFDLLMEKKVDPPYVPEVKGEVDTKYVPKAYLKDEAKDSFSEPPAKGTANPKFEAFTFQGDSNMG